MPKIAEIEATPNPNAIRFVLKERLSWGVAYSYDSVAAAAEDPLASKLFAIPNVTNVYYIDTWITVTQDGRIDWPDLIRELAEPIRGAPVMLKPEYVAGPDHADDDPRLTALRKLLDETVRPALMADGGDLQIVSLVGKVLTLRYYGACGSCPSSLASTLVAIKNLAQSIEPDLEVIAL